MQRNTTQRGIKARQRDGVESVYPAHARYVYHNTNSVSQSV